MDEMEKKADDIVEDLEGIHEVKRVAEGNYKELNARVHLFPERSEYKVLASLGSHTNSTTLTSHAKADDLFERLCEKMGLKER